MAIHVNQRPSLISVNFNQEAFGTDPTVTLATGVQSSAMTFKRGTRRGSHFEWSSADPTKVFFRAKRPLLCHVRGQVNFRTDVAGGVDGRFAVSVLVNGATTGDTISLTLPWGSHDLPTRRNEVVLSPGDALTLVAIENSGVQMKAVAGVINVWSTGYGADDAVALS